MRFLAILIAFLLLYSPADAQRVFRASSIDLEQNERLDVIETRLAKLESKPAFEPVFLPSPREQATKPAPKPKVEPHAVYVQPVATASNRYSTAELRSIAANYRGPLHATVEPRSWAWQHLQQDHGFSSDQVSGLSQSEAITIHSMAHGKKVTPFRSVSRSVSVVQSAPVQVVASPVRMIQAAGGCPNGRCPTSSRTVTRTRQRFGLFR